MPLAEAPVVTESIESRHTAVRDNRLFGQRVFHVANIESPLLALSVAGIPQLGEAYPDGSGLVAWDYDAQLVSGHATLVRVEVEYRESEFVPPDTNEEDLNSTSFQVRPQAQFADVWRTNPGLVFPPAGNADNQSFADIGGVRSDVSGEPVSYLKRSVSFVISETINVKTLDVPLYYSFTGTRNSAAFFNFVPGSLLYLGADVTGTFTGSKVRLTHEFLADEWFHLRQAPARDVNGTVELFTLATLPNGKALRVAETVYWRQPFPDTKPFKSISPNF